jgi:thiosulfate dehydrogenase
MAKKSSNGGFGKIVLGFLLGIAAVALGLFAYLKFGPLPVAVADAPLPFEKQVVKLPLNARIDRETKTAPFGISEDVFESGAHVYRTQCASCHGTPGHDVAFATHMFPSAPQLWKKHGSHGVVGVSDDEAGETYWKVANGIRLSGMPSYSRVLSDAQMWQVSLLLKNADKEMPGPVASILNAPAP